MFDLKNVVIPTSSPWIVVIDGARFVIPSTVCRLLYQLAFPKKVKAEAKKKAK